MKFINSIKRKGSTLLKKAAFSFLRKSPLIVNMAHKVSRAMRRTKEESFTRFYPNDLLKIFKRSPTSIKRNLHSKKYFITDSVVPPQAESWLGKVIRSLDEIPESDIPDSLFYIYFTCDSVALPILKKIIHSGGQILPPMNFYTDLRTSYRFVNHLAHNALKKTWSKSERLRLLDMIVHENLCEALELTRDIEGDYVEVGVYLGGSALTALNYINEQRKNGLVQSRKAWLLDTYDGFNYTEAKQSGDIMWFGSHKLYGTEATKMYLKDTLKDAGVEFELIQGNICSDNLPSSINKICVANIDVDMYEPTLAALNKVAGYIPKGGIIISEDSTATPGTYGAYLAMNEFLETEIGKKFMPIFKKGQYFLIKK
ncbi:MAG: TylF/MycF/NovP-related O-methyltransferase [Parafilimonas sp.]